MTQTDARETWQQALPKKCMAAGALFLDESEKILLVNPTYKPQWEIPGGIVEADESPRQACIREVEEELGLQVEPERLLNVAWKAPTVERIETLQFIFWGGTLSEDVICTIQLPPAELSEFRFVTIKHAAQLLTPSLYERVRLSYDLIDTERTIYMDT